MKKEEYKPITKHQALLLVVELMNLESDGVKRSKQYWKRHEAIMDYLNNLFVNGRI